ncbi:hypothetical protein PoB_001050900 [Plakobranchus ocellatus]|uniref:ETS domain-containing protein n=1 Tax=Plakobranchus ocellatus TaxID=259542 RepID=A0AAV3YPE6_9GAST|nr:hypothetical protein PoB_001050900 [Plakobranchus ocellatus]
MELTTHLAATQAGRDWTSLWSTSMNRSERPKPRRLRSCSKGLNRDLRTSLKLFVYIWFFFKSWKPSEYSPLHNVWNDDTRLAIWNTYSREKKKRVNVLEHFVFFKDQSKRSKTSKSLIPC